MTLICLATVVGRFEVTAQSSSPANKKLLHAVLAKNKEGKPATKFFTGSSKIYAFWKGDALTAGDKLQNAQPAAAENFSQKTPALGMREMREKKRAEAERRKRKKGRNITCGEEDGTAEPTISP